MSVPVYGSSVSPTPVNGWMSFRSTEKGLDLVLSEVRGISSTRSVGSPGGTRPRLYLRHRRTEGG